MSRPEEAGTQLDELLATPTPTPETGREENRAERSGRPARGRLEAWLRGGSDGREAHVDERADSPAGSAPDPSAPTGVPVEAVERATVDADGELRSVPVEWIEPNGYQPRRQFDEESLSSLADSIGVLGVLQPILVRVVGPDRYELIAGERRWRAAQRAGLRMIPALVREVTDQGALEQAIVENLHRQDLNVLEEAAAYQELTDDFGLTQDEVARRVGKSRSAVANTLRLLQLPGPVQQLVVEGRLSAGHARAVLSLRDRAAQITLAERIVADELTVRQAEEAARLVGEGEAGGGAGGGSRRPKSVGALEVQMLLEERLATRVEVQEVGRGGRLVIRFADDADLGRIVQLLVDEASATNQD